MQNKAVRKNAIFILIFMRRQNGSVEHFTRLESIAFETANVLRMTQSRRLRLISCREMLDVVGFDTSVPAVIANFARE